MSPDLKTSYEHPPFKEIAENTLQIRTIAPPDFHLQGQTMDRFLEKMTEAAGMEAFTVPVSLDPTNSETSLFAAPHPLGGRKRARDENGFLGWRDSWVSVCVYNGTRDTNGVQVTITAHTCGSIATEKILRVVHTAVQPRIMQWGKLSSLDGVANFQDYEFTGDEHFKAIVGLLSQAPKTREEIFEAAQLLEREVLARRAVREQDSTLKTLDKLLLKDELKRLQEIFGRYEGALEQETAERIINEDAIIDSFPYIKRYDQLTDTEIERTEMDNARTVCMVGGGSLPISAILYARKTNAHVFVIEKDSIRAGTATRVVDKLGLKDKITIYNQMAETVDYSGMDVVVFAAMTEDKDKVLQQASKTDFPRTIVLRGPLGDSKVFYPGFTTQELFGKLTEKLHHYPDRYDVQAEDDGVFSLLYLDSHRVVSLP